MAIFWSYWRLFGVHTAPPQLTLASQLPHPLGGGSGELTCISCNWVNSGERQANCSVSEAGRGQWWRSLGWVARLGGIILHHGSPLDRGEEHSQAYFNS